MSYKTYLEYIPWCGCLAVSPTFHESYFINSENGFIGLLSALSKCMRDFPDFMEG